MMDDETDQATLVEARSVTGNGRPAVADEEREGYQYVSWIGFIPNHWGSARLGSLTKKIGSGLTPRGGSEAYTSRGVTFLRSQNIYPGWMELDDVVFISAEQHAAMSVSRVHPRDVLLNITGASIGRSCVVPRDFEEANVNQHVCIIRSNGRIEPYYLSSILNHHIGQSQIYSFQAGGSREGLNYDQIRSFWIPTPPLPEQRKIARILGAWDRALADLDALIEAKRRRKRGLAQRLLTGRVRLRGFGCAEMVETKIGTVPSDWREVRFGKVFKRQSEKNESSAIKRVITVGKYAIRPQSEHFDKSVASADLSNYNVIRPGDFVYDPMSAYYGAIGRYDYEEPGIVSPVYRVLKLRRGFDSGFIKHLLKAHYVRHRIASYSTQGNKEGKRRGLQHVAFKAIPIFVPTEEEQRRIAGVLDAADAELAALDAQRDALAHQKRGLMQRLLTGEVRVTPDNEDYHIAESECNA